MGNVIHKTVRLGSTDSVFSVNKDFNIGIGINGTKKMLPYNDLSRAVDAYSVYEKEKENSDKFRLTLTIKPFCSNVLYNSCTEIIKDEGNPQTTSPVLDTGNGLSFSYNEVVGKSHNVKRVDMVNNTEYSRENLGLTYHPGVDMFDNHMFRSKGFRVLCKSNESNHDKVNTLMDTMRYYDGTKIKAYSRDASPNPLNPMLTTKHMYEYDNTLTFLESISANLSEDDGWFGFYNICSVESEYENLRMPNKIIQSGKGCDFVDLYPDRTLFSFTPKYNKYLDRKEDNWSVVLTYPYDNFDKHPLVRDVVGYSNGNYKFGNINALLLMSVEVYNNGSGDRRVMFRTYTKHGLNPGDVITLYYRHGSIYDILCGTASSYSIGKYHSYPTPVVVSATGDYNGDNEEYFFSANAFDVIRHVFNNWENDNVSDIGSEDSDSSDSSSSDECFFNPDNATDSEVNNRLSQFRINNTCSLTFRFTRVVSDIESKYYFRVMRRLPNFKYASKQLDKETASDKDAFNVYYANNAYRQNGTSKEFVEYDKEMYKLAFSNTVYNDDITQFVVMDDVISGNLVDNLGRPLTEVYYTMVKRNDGHEKWYNGVYRDDKSITFSKCFGKLASGIDFLPLEIDSFGEMRKHKAVLSDCHVINNKALFNSMAMENYDNLGNQTSGIQWNNEFFMGDLVSCNDMESIEIVLGDLCHRFNTKQREFEQNSSYAYRFSVHEVVSNDSDSNTKVNVYPDESGINAEVVHPEGYYYKAHYPVKIGELGPVNQGSHQSVLVYHAEPVQSGGVYIKVMTNSKHHLYGGNEMFICDDSARVWYKSQVADVIDDYTVLIEPISQLNWIDTAEKLSNGTFRLRKRNYDIPDYAVNVLTNTFIWRNRRGNGDVENDVIAGYPFSNGCFYVDTVVNFYLKRQDPFGISGLRDYSNSSYAIGVYGDEYKKSGASFAGEDKVVC